MEKRFYNQVYFVACPKVSFSGIKYDLNIILYY